MPDSKDQLRDAIGAGDLATVRRLIEAEPDLRDAIIRPGENRDYRPVTEAAVECQLEILDYLIGAGADVTQDDDYALKRSCLYDRCVPVLDVLVRHGADVNAPGAIIAATEGMALDCLRWLLEHGATITGTARQGGREVHWNAFTHAAHFEKNRPGMLALMLEHGVGVDDAHPDEGNTLGSTALHNTARQGDVDGVKLLLQHGADVTIRNELDETPVDVAKNDEVRALLVSDASDQVER